MLKQHRNKKFNYKPRFSKENATNTKLEDDSKVDEFASKWERAKKTNTNRKGIVKRISMSMLIIILVLLLTVIYMLDF